MNYNGSESFALDADKADPLSAFTQQFHKPKHNEKEGIYFCGNSLGLQPKKTSNAIAVILQQWRELAVDGHFYGEAPWIDLHQKAKPVLAKLLGAKEVEVSPMNNLSSNLHFMMVSFFQPSGKRNKILIEKGAFPSDSYAVDSQIDFHGLKPEDILIEVEPDPSTHLLDMEEIIHHIEDAGDELALVLLPGIQYYTGQLLGMEKITQAAHSVGAIAGFDLAHAIGNVRMQLHEWKVDFAVWCTYKYLNSGPGAVSGIFVHEKYSEDRSLKRFAGWWGHDRKRRFLMERKFVPMKGAEGWHLSNMEILTLASHIASLELFEEAGIENLFEKRDLLTGYLEFLLNEVTGVEIITPKDRNQRGSQLSISLPGGKEIFEKLVERGITGDWREPNVIRVAPVPMYNTYYEVYSFVQVLKEILSENGKS